MFKFLFCFCVLFLSYLKAEPSVIEIAKLCSDDPNKQNLFFEAYGMLSNKHIDNIRFSGNYGLKTSEGKIDFPIYDTLRDKEYNYPNDCLAGLIQHLFPSPDGVILSPNTRDGDIIGLIAKTISSTKNQPTENSKLSRKDQLEIVKNIISRLIKNENLETIEDIRNFEIWLKQEYSKNNKIEKAKNNFYQFIKIIKQAYSSCNDSKGIYPKQIVEKILIAFVIRLTNNAKDLITILGDSLDLKIDPDYHNILTTIGFDFVSIKVPASQDISLFVDQVKNEFEKEFFYTKNQSPEYATKILEKIISFKHIDQKILSFRKATKQEEEILKNILYSLLGTFQINLQDFEKLKSNIEHNNYDYVYHIYKTISSIDPNKIKQASIKAQNEKTLFNLEKSKKDPQKLKIKFINSSINDFNKDNFLDNFDQIRYQYNLLKSEDFVKKIVLFAKIYNDFFNTIPSQISYSGNSVFKQNTFPNCVETAILNTIFNFINLNGSINQEFIENFKKHTEKQQIKNSKFLQFLENSQPISYYKTAEGQKEWNDVVSNLENPDIIYLRKDDQKNVRYEIKSSIINILNVFASILHLKDLEISINQLKNLGCVLEKDIFKLPDNQTDHEKVLELIKEKLETFCNFFSQLSGKTITFNQDKISSDFAKISFNFEEQNFDLDIGSIHAQTFVKTDKNIVEDFCHTYHKYKKTPEHLKNDLIKSLYTDSKDKDFFDNKYKFWNINYNNLSPEEISIFIKNLITKHSDYDSACSDLQKTYLNIAGLLMNKKIALNDNFSAHFLLKLLEDLNAEYSFINADNENKIDDYAEKIIHDHAINILKKPNNLLHAFFNKEVSQFFKKSNLSLNSKDNRGSTPLHVALENNVDNLQTIRSLISPENLTITNNVGETPLHTALIQRASPEIIKALITPENKRIMGGTDHRTPLEIAISQNLNEEIQNLLK